MNFKTMKTLQIMLRHRIAPIKARSANRPMSSWVAPSEYDRSPYEVLAEKWRTFDKTMADARSQKEGPLRWTPPTYKNESFLALQKHQSGSRSLQKQSQKSAPLIVQEPPQSLPNVTDFEEHAASPNKMSIDNQTKSVHQVQQESNEVSEENQQFFTLNTSEVPQRKSAVQSFQEKVYIDESKIEDISFEKAGRKKLTKDGRGRKVSFVEEPTKIFYPKDAPKEGSTTKELNAGNVELITDSQTGENIHLEDGMRSFVEASQKEMPLISEITVASDEDSVNFREPSKKGSSETPVAKTSSRLVRSKSSTSKHESKRTVSTKTVKKRPEDTLEKEQFKRTGSESQNIQSAFMNTKKNRIKTLPTSVGNNAARNAEEEENFQVQESQSLSGTENKVNTPHRQKLSKNTSDILNKHTIRKDKNLSNFHSSTEMLRKARVTKPADTFRKASKVEKPVKNRFIGENLLSPADGTKTKLNKSIKRTVIEPEISATTPEESNWSNNENQPENSIVQGTRKNNPSKRHEQRSKEDTEVENFDNSSSNRVPSTNENNKPDPAIKVKKSSNKGSTGIQRINKNDFQKSSGQIGNVSSFEESSSSPMITDRFPSSADQSRDSIFNKKKYEDLRKYIAEAEVELRVQKQMFNSQRQELKKRLRKLALNPLTEIERSYKNHFPQPSDNLNKKNKNKLSPKQNAKLLNEDVNNASVVSNDRENQMASNALEENRLIPDENPSVNDSSLSERPPVETEYHLSEDKVTEAVQETDTKNGKLQRSLESKSPEEMVEIGEDANPAVAPYIPQSDAKTLNRNNYNKRKTISNKKENITSEYSEENSNQRNQMKLRSFGNEKLLKNEEYEPTSNSKENDFSQPIQNDTRKRPSNKTKSLMFDYYRETPQRSNTPAVTRKHTSDIISSEVDSSNQISMLRPNFTGNKANARKNYHQTKQYEENVESTEVEQSQNPNQNIDDDNDLKISQITKAYNDLLQQSEVKAKKKQQNKNLHSFANSQESVLNQSKLRLHQRFVDRINQNKANKSVANTHESGLTTPIEDSSESPHEISLHPEHQLQDDTAEGRNNSYVKSFKETINSTKEKDSSKLLNQNKFKTNFKRVQPSITQPILDQFKKKYPQQSMSKRDYYIPPSRSLTENKYTASLPIINQLLYEEDQNDTLKNNSKLSKLIENKNFELCQSKNSFTNNLISIPLKKNSSDQMGHSKADLSIPLSFSEILNKQKNKSLAFMASTNPLISQKMKSSNKLLDVKTTTGNIDNVPSQRENPDLNESYSKKNPLIKSGFKESTHNITSQTPVHLNKEHFPYEDNPFKSESVISKSNKTNTGRKMFDNLELTEELPHLKVGERSSIGNNKANYDNTLVQQFLPGLGLSTFNEEVLNSTARKHSPQAVNLKQRKPSLDTSNKNNSIPTFQNIKNKIKEQCFQMELQLQEKEHKPQSKPDKLIAVKSDENDKLQIQTSLKTNKTNIKLVANANSSFPIPALSPMFEVKPINKALNNKPDKNSLKSNLAEHSLIRAFKDNVLLEKKSSVLSVQTPNISQIQLKSKSPPRIPETVELGVKSQVKYTQRTGNENNIKENSINNHLQKRNEVYKENSEEGSSVLTDPNNVQSAVSVKDTTNISKGSSRVRKDQHVVSLNSNSFNNNSSSFPASPLRKRSNIFRRRKPITPKKPDVPKFDPYLSSTSFNIQNLDSIFRIDESTHLPGLPIRKWKSPTTEKVIFVATIPPVL